jgi:hypothetical protein
MAVRDPAKLCKAVRNGQQCHNYRIRGGTVCRIHGGAAPHVRESAQQRIRELVDPALGEIAKIIYRKNVSDADKLKACYGLLDRAGYGPGSKLILERSETDLTPRVIELMRTPPPMSEETRGSVTFVPANTEDSLLPAHLAALLPATSAPALPGPPVNRKPSARAHRADSE